MSSLWDWVAAALADAGCDLVTGLPTDEPGLLDAARAHGGLRTLVVRDQRIGACAAAGHARVSGATAVFAAAPGPVLPNALVGLIEAASLCLPIVVVTTRIPREELGHGGFQELDQHGLAMSFAKWYYLVEEAASLGWALRQAVRRAVNGRPGVTVVELTHELLETDAASLGSPAGGPVRRLRGLPEPATLAAAAASVARARRPVVILGGGARAAGDSVADLVRRWPAAVLTTAAGRGTVPEDAAYACGLAGLYLTPPVDALVRDADLILAAGTRLEETARMRWTKAPGAALVQIDCDPDAFDLGWPADIALLGDAELTVAALAREPVPGDPAERETSQWPERVAEARAQARGRWCTDDFAAFPAAATLTALSEVFDGNVTYVHENGLHDIWSYHWPVLTVPRGAAVVVPGEQTALGFGVAAAAGAALADRRRPTVVICGDAALGMNLTALALLAEYQLGVAVIVFDNAGPGWPRLARQRAGLPDDLTRTSVGLPFESFARDLGYAVMTPRTGAELRGDLRTSRIRAEQGQLSLLRVSVDDRVLPPGVSDLYG